MAYGFWGSRFPIFNFISTKTIFLIVKVRLNWLTLRNKIKARSKIIAPLIINDEKICDELDLWISKGFNKLNIGGGVKNLQGFINIDFVRHPLVEREVVANILDLSFIPSNSITQIHSNHVIEHLTELELKTQLQECKRILQPRGLLTIRCPNILGVSYGFWFTPVIEDDKEAFIKLGFPADEDFSNPEDTWAHKDLFGFLHWVYGDVGNIENQHLNFLTPSKLYLLLEENGFKVLRMTKPETVNLAVVAINNL